MKACVFTLGCKMNEVESASLMQGLEELGYETTDIPSQADVYLINTCAVTAEAEKKSRQAVARLRKFNKDAPVVVFGCAAEHRGEDFSAREGVLFVSGAQAKNRVLELFRAGLQSAGGAHEKFTETEFCELPTPKRTRTRAFLRIQDGCNNFCSYCLIPYLRGRTRSRSAEKIVAEAMACAAKEIVLTGIDISSYRDGETGLGELLLKLKDIKKRIRLGSIEAGLITREFLEQMKSAGNVMPHFHLSLQSGSSAVLKAMNRHYTREEYLEKCALIYEYFPDAAITTDIIVGFPTETEEDFLQSLSVIEEARFARVHCFPFSPREGTVAYRMKDLPASVKKERMGRILNAAEAAEKEYLARFAGQELTALFEEDGGYTENYIRVYLDGAQEGELVKVRLTGYTRDGMMCERA
ncbi:MAG: tRNA (N(6)-L-threonylcarbamoyladenosine(37)-C(2))-methylthiotransferase MtaB [Clostridiales bacterium]|nr:tRNA (N(6)-L-threonylcarbamoyladenosine(37)-C(2))-methylthiotransferase MtaB [Clostridiales bacterium]